MPQAATPSRPGVPLPTDAVAIGSSATQGSVDAPVVVFEYSDFECPFCGSFVRESLPTLKAQYIDSGKAQFVFRHLPLDQIHKRARAAAEAADCARQAGRFWEMHNRLFRERPSLTKAALVEHAVAAGIDRRAFTACVNSNRGEPQVALDAASAKALRVSATPSFLIGRRQTDGLVKIEALVAGARRDELVEAIEAVLRSLTGPSGSQ